MFAHIILASASTASSKMSAKHQENDTPVKASHLLLVIAVCQVLVPEHCLLGEPPKHEKFVSFHKSSDPQPKDGHHSPKLQDASVQGSWHMGNPSTSLRHWQLGTARSTVSVRGNGMLVSRLAKEFSPNRRLCQPKSLLRSSKKLMSQSPQHALGHPGLPNH